MDHKHEDDFSEDDEFDPDADVSQSFLPTNYQVPPTAVPALPTEAPKESGSSTALFILTEVIKKVESEVTRGQRPVQGAQPDAYTTLTNRDPNFKLNTLFHVHSIVCASIQHIQQNINDDGELKSTVDRLMRNGRIQTTFDLLAQLYGVYSSPFYARNSTKNVLQILQMSDKAVPRHLSDKEYENLKEALESEQTNQWFQQICPSNFPMKLDLATIRKGLLSVFVPVCKPNSLSEILTSSCLLHSSWWGETTTRFATSSKRC